MHGYYMISILLPIVVLILPKCIYCAISRNHRQIKKNYPNCSDFQNTLQLQICELYQIEFLDEDYESEHEKINLKYQDALFKSSSTQDSIITEQFFKHFVDELEPNHVNLMHYDSKIVKDLMKNDIYINYFQQNQTRISVNSQNVNIISKTYSEVDLWMIKVVELNANNSDLTWLIHGNISSLNPSIRIYIDTNFYMYQIYDTYIIINEVYRKADYLPLISRLWGIWTPKIGLVYNEAFKWSRRKDLTGVLFRIVTLNWDQYVIARPINGTKYQHAEGLFIDVVKEIQYQLNFTYWIVLSDKWGYLHPNGTWEGTFGLLQRNEADLAMAPALTPARTRYFDFVRTITQTQYYLHISPPEKNFKGQYAFIAPYSYGIWISLLATIITFSILWPVIWKILLQDKSCNVVNDNITFQYSFLIFLGLILQKGSPYEPNSIAMKIQLGIIAYLSVVMFAAYSANLISVLLTVNVELPFNSYHSFYYDTNYKFGFINGTSFDELFQDGSELQRKMYNERWKDFSDREALRAYTKSHQYAMIYSKYPTCDFFPIIKVKTLQTSLHFRKRSPYIPIINNQLDKIFDAGIIMKLHQQWLPKSVGNCLNKDSSTVKPIEFEMVLSAFVTLGFFLIIACIIFVCEKSQRK